MESSQRGTCNPGEVLPCNMPHCAPEACAHSHPFLPWPMHSAAPRTHRLPLGNLLHQLHHAAQHGARPARQQCMASSTHPPSGLSLCSGDAAGPCMLAFCNPTHPLSHPPSATATRKPSKPFAPTCRRGSRCSRPPAQQSPPPASCAARLRARGRSATPAPAAACASLAGRRVPHPSRPCRRSRTPGAG